MAAVAVGPMPRRLFSPNWAEKVDYGNKTTKRRAPEKTRIWESGIEPIEIQRKVSGYPRGQIPPGCTVLTQGIDVKKIALHWAGACLASRESERGRPWCAPRMPSG